MKCTHLHPTLLPPGEALDSTEFPERPPRPLIKSSPASAWSCCGEGGAAAKGQGAPPTSRDLEKTSRARGLSRIAMPLSLSKIKHSK